MLPPPFIECIPLTHTKFLFQAVPAWKNDDRPLGSKSSNDTSLDSNNNKKRRTISTTNAISAANNYNSQLSRMLHQIQSDIKVKEELVSHLEKSETEFTFMRRKFDEKINLLQSQLAETQKEKDMALMRTKSGLAIKSDIANLRGPQTTPAIDNGAAATKQNIAEIRHSYEVKMKNLVSEMQDLRRKYAHATITMQSTRNQNESLLRSLKVNVETLKTEKKRLMHRMKLESDRVREQMSRQERKIQQLQRQHAKSNQAKKRLEREHEQQKSTLKKRNEEILINSSQLKQMISIMKKAVREGGILDEKMLSKVTPIMGGTFAVIARGGGHGFPRRVKKKNPIPLGIRVTRKKQLLDKALYQYIQGKQAVVEMEQLLVRRERLVEEKMELEEERDQIYHVEREHEETTGQPMDTIAIELMDERIDLISAEITYLSARIRTLQAEAAEEALQAEESGVSVAAKVASSSSRPPKHVTFADEIITEEESQADTATTNDEWADIDVFDDQFTVPANAAPEMAYDITSKLIKSFEADECKRIIENLVDDIMDLRMSECNRQVTVQNLEKTVVDLRRTLIVMKKAAISSSIDTERHIRQVEIGEENMLDMMMQEEEDNNLMEEYMGDTMFDKIYENGVRGLIPAEAAQLMSELPAASSSTYHPQVSLPSSPVASPPYGNSAYPPTAAVVNNNLPPAAPTKMMDNISKNVVAPPARDSTPSPDRFYNMIQKRLSWQQQHENDTLESDLARDASNNNRSSSPDFGLYASDHGSSTSSIRSSHLRRSSIQSDMSSLSSWNQKTMMRGSSSGHNNLNNTAAVAPTLLSPVMPSTTSNTPRPKREIATISPLLSHTTNKTELDSLENYQQPQQRHSPTFTASYQQQRNIKRPLPPLMPSISTFDRPITPTVFDRLAQTPTRASRAKMNYRHSSGSVDDLRRRWEVEQKRPSSVMGGTFT